jgi:hypothetical protein
MNLNTTVPMFQREMLNYFMLTLLWLIVPTIALAQSDLPRCPQHLSTVRWSQCFGELRHPDGSGYSGEWLRGKRHGKGEAILSNGTSFVGEYGDHRRSGLGIEYDQNGSVIRSGRWADDQLTASFELDTRQFPFYQFRFRGNDTQLTSTTAPQIVTLGASQLPLCPNVGMRNNCYGQVSRPDGETYIGEFSEDKYHGKGIQTFPSGARYEGEFREGKSSGQGTLVFADGRKYSGGWQLDQLHGEGTMIFRDGRKYVGTFKNNRYHGTGVYLFPNGESYDGDWQEGSRHGRGTWIYKDGSRYVGQWVDDKRHGIGILYASTCKVTSSGTWERDNFVRQETLQVANFPFGRTEADDNKCRQQAMIDQQLKQKAAADALATEKKDRDEKEEARKRQEDSTRRQNQQVSLARQECTNRLPRSWPNLILTIREKVLATQLSVNPSSISFERAEFKEEVKNIYSLWGWCWVSGHLVESNCRLTFYHPKGVAKVPIFFAQESGRIVSNVCTGAGGWEGAKPPSIFDK